MKNFLKKLNDNFVETCFCAFAGVAIAALCLFACNVVTGVAAGAAIVLAGLAVVIAFTIKSRF